MIVASLWNFRPVSSVSDQCIPASCLLFLLLLSFDSVAQTVEENAIQESTVEETTAATTVKEPPGYRQDDYDADVPATLEGATRVQAVDVHRLMEQEQAFVIDVIPEHRPPRVLPEGQKWFPVAHVGIAGALWLPDVGYGSLSETTEAYFRWHLWSSTGGNEDHPLVFYCRSRCWMSWNAARRAVSYGFTSVYWFSEGIDDWRFEGFDTATLSPAPGRRHEARDRE